ncbi:WD repeat-containing protein 26, putative [Plasmodium berghei]|uniref:WD repeat-containing protein 26, putative n=2 Tax=Plasmodium berghei TaxID=5821 RepID=A0A509AQQ0_PLABA|nr:WD repeat-containing protein 26, putative [Plasmodium berghei ANKA]CXI81055.1 WD repeat-containing protein 26, putative [Plasmodium berghei]SCM25474.1 WD repeat-containing protein 26, putative [Plasmodium berghei]SCN27378.1 WD repeat-containing protein 26, putative [Plasmodium berghei]SCO62038.1 WD repeat-containing protein 26, putative [Plasmodium berghei]SCO63804.1 WD repeat-containing protein 26, putative [Plasmodium berghei]|eukprot:XP_034423011.1 WD repeat-containing protein 26, putative [Plasmodium berghei ANKA]
MNLTSTFKRNKRKSDEEISHDITKKLKQCNMLKSLVSIQSDELTTSSLFVKSLCKNEKINETKNRDNRFLSINKIMQKKCYKTENIENIKKNDNMDIDKNHLICDKNENNFNFNHLCESPNFGHKCLKNIENEYIKNKNSTKPTKNNFNNNEDMYRMKKLPKMGKSEKKSERKKKLKKNSKNNYNNYNTSCESNYSSSIEKKEVEFETQSYNTEYLWEGLLKKDVVLLLIQAIKNMGYKKSAKILESESGIELEQPLIKDLHKNILKGNWGNSINNLKKLNINKKLMKAIKFLIYEQCFIEYLYQGKYFAALRCLRNKLRKSCFDEDTYKRLHECTTFFMFQNFENANNTIDINTTQIHSINDNIKLRNSRKILFEKINRLLPEHILIPPRRLAILLHQSLKYQVDNCLFHNNFSDLKLTKDIQYNRILSKSRLSNTRFNHHKNGKEQENRIDDKIFKDNENQKNNLYNNNFRDKYYENSNSYEKKPSQYNYTNNESSLCISTLNISNIEKLKTNADMQNDQHNNINYSIEYSQGVESNSINYMSTNITDSPEKIQDRYLNITSNAPTLEILKLKNEIGANIEKDEKDDGNKDIEKNTISTQYANNSISENLINHSLSNNIDEIEKEETNFNENQILVLNKKYNCNCEIKKIQCDCIKFADNNVKICQNDNNAILYSETKEISSFIGLEQKGNLKNNKMNLLNNYNKKYIHKNNNITACTHLSLLKNHECKKIKLPYYCIKVLQGHTDEVWYVSVSSDGKYIASSSKDKSIFLWKGTYPFNKLREWNGHLDGVSYICWSYNNKYLASGSNDSNIIIWSPKSNKKKLCLTMHSGPITSVCWTKNNSTIISSAFDKKIYCTKVNIELKSFSILYAWSFSTRIQNFVFTKNEKYLIVVPADKNVRIIDFNMKKELYILPENDTITSLCASNLYNHVLVNIADQKPIIKLWDIKYRYVIQSYRGHKQGRFILHSTFGGKNEAYVISGSEDSLIYIWHRTKGYLLDVINGHASNVNIAIWPIAFSKFPYMISASDDHTIMIWNTHPKINKSKKHIYMEREKRRNAEKEKKKSKKNIFHHPFLRELAKLSGMDVQILSPNDSHMF